MKEENKYNWLKWTLFVPLAFFSSIFFMFIIQTIPIVWIINKLFDFSESNPLKTEIVNGPVGFLLVFISSVVPLVLSTVLSISITPKPKLAWKIIWAIQLLPLLFLVLLYEITGKNEFNGNFWYSVAQSLSLITAAVISFFICFNDD